MYEWEREGKRTRPGNAVTGAKGLFRLGSDGGHVIFYTSLTPDVWRGRLGLKLYPLRVTSPTAYKFSHEKKYSGTQFCHRKKPKTKIYLTLFICHVFVLFSHDNRPVDVEIMVFFFFLFYFFFSTFSFRRTEVDAYENTFSYLISILYIREYN